MKSVVYDCKNLETRLAARIRREVERFRRQHSIDVGLGIVLVTGEQMSMSDAGRVAASAEELGIRVSIERIAQRNIGRKFFPTLEEYAANPAIQGIYIQLPLPTEIISLEEVMKRLPPEKDVAGMHFVNRGKATYEPHEVEVVVRPPENAAVARVLAEWKAVQKGRKVTVVGSSSTSGMVKLLVAHLYDLGFQTRTLRFENIMGTLETRSLRRLKDGTASDASASAEPVNADGEVLITWANQPGWLTGSRLTPGSMVIDMGYRFARGKISGDCDFQSVSQVASLVTPVPGGIRNVIRMMILDNLVRVIQRQVGAEEEKGTRELRRRFGVAKAEGRRLS